MWIFIYNERSNKIDYLVFPKNELENLLVKSKQGFYYEFGELSQYVRDLTHTYYLEMQRNKKIAKLDDVEELTNTVFLAFAEEYQDIKNISYWLRRVLFLTYITYYKKNKDRSLLMQAEAAAQSGSKKAMKMSHLNILKVLSLLGEDKQKIIRLKLWANLNFSLIAENIKKSESEVFKIFVRTLITIKNRLR